MPTAEGRLAIPSPATMALPADGREFIDKLFIERTACILCNVARSAYDSDHIQDLSGCFIVFASAQFFGLNLELRLLGDNGLHR